MHFDFEGYDTSPFWDDDGTSYIVGSHAYKVKWVSESTFSMVIADLTIVDPEIILPK